MDSAALAELYLAHRLRFLMIAMRCLRNFDDAEEAVQEGFLLAHKRLSQFDGRSSMTTWLFRIVVNCCLTALRRRRCRPESRAVPLEYDLPAPQNPEAELLSRERRAAVVREIVRLPVTYQRALHRSLAGMPLHSTAKTHKLRAIHTLARRRRAYA